MTASKLDFDFRSDTLTEPDAGMLKAMSEAPLGDDVFGEDPTILLLQERVAEMTGKEAALFFPSGTQANLTAMMEHAKPGTVLYAGVSSHVKLYELGGYARVAGLSLREIGDDGGYLDLDHLASVWSPDIYYIPQPGLICVENTHNILGGLTYPEAKLAEVAAFAKERGVPLHMDGARLWHAAVALDKPLRYWTDHVDSVMLCVSKGLGAPVGSLLAGSSDLIERARRTRKLLGGGMRQGGVLAAAGLYALDHNLPRLDLNHRQCRQAFEGIADLDWLNATEPQTNILIYHLKEPKAREYVAAMDRQGLRLLALSETTVRAVFHLDLREDAAAKLVAATRGWRDDL